MKVVNHCWFEDWDPKFLELLFCYAKVITEDGIGQRPV